MRLQGRSLCDLAGRPGLDPSTLGSKKELSSASVVEYYNDYICPVPAAKQQLLHVTGWNKAALASLKPEIDLAISVSADSTVVFPTSARVKASKSYYNFKTQAEIGAWATSSCSSFRV